MKKNHRNFFVCFSLLIYVFAARADTLVLKDGKVLQGTFTGGTKETLQFEVNGKIETVALDAITSLTFSPRQAPTGAAAPPAAAVGAAAPAVVTTGPGTIPAGTKLMLKMSETISTTSHKKGTKVSAVLENDLMSGGTVVAAKGTPVYGTALESVGGRALGVAKLLVTFTDLSINNQLIPIVTDDVGAASEPGKTAKAVGAGALVGAAAGDAGAGAAVGGAVALMSSRKNHIQVPAGTLVEVSLKQPVTVP